MDKQCDENLRCKRHVRIWSKVVNNLNEWRVVVNV